MIRETTHARLAAVISNPAGTGFAPKLAASPSALPASVRPMTIAIGPVTDAGRILSMMSLPHALTRKPAAMDTKPDITMPNCAIAILSLSVRPESCYAPMRPRIADRYEKLEP